MLKTRGNVNVYLGPNAVFQNNQSAAKAGCLLIAGESSDVARSKVYMDGATIQDCSTTMDDVSGGAVFINCGVFIMNSGTITGCTGRYAAVHVYGNFGRFEMNGGSITNCTSTGGYGGAIFMNANMSSYMLINGGSITGNTAGASTTLPVASQKVSGSTVNVENAPDVTGYTFAGWIGADITTAQKIVIIPTGSTGNRVYTAKWTKNSDDPTGPVKYTISYDLNGGTMDGKTAIVTVDIENGTEITLPAPTSEGYVFDVKAADEELAAFLNIIKL